MKKGNVTFNTPKLVVIPNNIIEDIQVIGLNAFGIMTKLIQSMQLGIKIEELSKVGGSIGLEENEIEIAVDKLVEVGYLEYDKENNSIKINSERK